jgi:hypothetical protein
MALRQVPQGRGLGEGEGEGERSAAEALIILGEELLSSESEGAPAVATPASRERAERASSSASKSLHPSEGMTGERRGRERRNTNIFYHVIILGYPDASLIGAPELQKCYNNRNKMIPSSTSSCSS